MCALIQFGIFNNFVLFIPYGVPHDQKLEKAVVSEAENKINLTFGIMLSPEDCSADVFSRYKDFHHCKMKIRTDSPSFSCYVLESSVNRRNRSRSPC